jgi:hypothetical protein
MIINKRNSLKIKKNAQLFVLFFSMFIWGNANAFLETVTVNGGFSQTWLKVSVLADGNTISASDANLSQDYSGRGFGLGVSFDVYRALSLEFLYNSMGQTKITSFNRVRESGDVSFQGTTFYAVYAYPYRKHGFQFQGKVGFFSLATNTDLDYIRQTNNTGVSVGGGLSYFTRDGWGGQLSLHVHSSKLQIFALNLAKRFNLVTVETKLSDNENPSLFGTRVAEDNSEFALYNQQTGLSVIDNEEVSASTTDSDGDGVSDDRDLCEGTPLGAQVDSNGCSSLEQDIGAFKDSDLIDNNLLYPDEQLIDEDQNIAFDSFGDDSFDRVVPIGANTLRNLLGNRADVDRREVAGIEAFLADDRSSSQNVDNINDEITATELFRLNDNGVGSQEGEDDIFSEAGRQISGVGSALLEPTQRVLNLTGTDQVGDIAGVQADPFVVSEREKRRNQQRALINPSQDKQKNETDDAFVADMNELRAQIKSQIDEGIKPAKIDDSNNIDNFNDDEEINADLLNKKGSDDNSLYNVVGQPIVFEEGTFDLDNEQRDYLREVALQLRSNPNSRLELRVWKQSNNNSDKETAISQVKEVKNFLLENGVDRSQIDNIAEYFDIQASREQANRVVFDIIE